MTPFHCVGGAGVFPFRCSWTKDLQWNLMKDHRSSVLRTSTSHSFPYLEQDLLPDMQLRTEEQPFLRVVVCGSIWDGPTCYTQTFSGLLQLQTLLDTQGLDCLNALDGNFALGYLSPDLRRIYLSRSITSTRGLYYRATDTALTWSTNPADLFAEGRPTLDAIDTQMVAIAAATGLADRQRTCYKDVYGVPPGSMICFQETGSTSVMRTDYLRREDNTHLSYAQATRRLREHIQDAVARSLSGFSAYNLFISGGLDTAVVAYEASRLGKAIHGFHWAWNLPLFRDESIHAQAVADRFGIPLHTLDFSASLAPGGDYVQRMQGLLFPYNHAFYTCFAETIASVANIDSGNVHVLAGGHLGDTLFQGDWADPFCLTERSPRSVLQLFKNVLAWYPRHEVLTIFWYLLTKQRDLEENPGKSRIASNQPLFTPQAFQQVLAYGSVDYRDIQSDYWKRQPFQARMVAAALQGDIDFNAAHETSLTYRDGLAQQVILSHPLSDRRLHEFCLSLGPQHRNRCYAGQDYSKFLLRLAYLNDLPQDVIKREIRSPYAAISEQFCLQNRQYMREVFDQQALLSRLSIIDASRIQEVLAESDLCQKHSRSLVRIAGVEMWLQGLAERARSMEHRQPSLAIVSRARNVKPGEGVIALCPFVVAHTINGNDVLIHTQTLEVSRFDDTGMLFWEALTEERTWAEVLTRLHAHQPEETPLEETQSLIETFADELVRQGWIILKDDTHKERNIDAFSTYSSKHFSGS